MNPMPNLPLQTWLVILASCAMNFVAWYLAGRRTHYMQRLDVIRTMRVVYVEDLIPYLAVGGLLMVPDVVGKVLVALIAAAGGSWGGGLSVVVERRKRRKERDESLRNAARDAV